MSILLSTDMNSPFAVPYFLWDEPMTVAELKRRLSRRSPERIRLLGKILREARDTDVWKFTTPQDVAGDFSELSPYLGRRREFWKFLLAAWEKEGLIEGKQT